MARLGWGSCHSSQHVHSSCFPPSSCQVPHIWLKTQFVSDWLAGSAVMVLAPASRRVTADFHNWQHNRGAFGAAGIAGRAAVPPSFTSRPARHVTRPDAHSVPGGGKCSPSRPNSQGHQGTGSSQQVSVEAACCHRKYGPPRQVINSAAGLECGGDPSGQSLEWRQCGSKCHHQWGRQGGRSSTPERGTGLGPRCS